MAAGLGNQCGECYHKDLFSRRNAINAAAIRSPNIESLYSEYCLWLEAQIGAARASAIINSHFEFFSTADIYWESAPSYNQLLEKFGTSELRKYALIMKWLTSTGVITIDHSKKQQDSENRNIETIIHQLDPLPVHQKIAREYEANLREKQLPKKLTLKTIRVSMRAAVSFLIQSKRIPPTQDDLNQYLKKFPGQRAAVTGFVSYLRHTHNATLESNIHKSQQAALRERTLKRKLMQLLQVDNPESTETAWVKIGLQYFHKMSVRRINKLDFSQIKHQDDGLTIEVDGKELWLPYQNTERIHSSVGLD